MNLFKLPDLGEGLPEAEIVEWHVAPGDTVKVDTILVSVETAKAIVDIPSPKDGVIASLFGQVGDVIHTGEPLVEFVDAQPEIPGKPGKQDKGAIVGDLPESAQVMSSDDFEVASSHGYVPGKPAATPAAAALAERLGVDLSTVRGSGQSGQVHYADVEKARQQQRGSSEHLRGVRKAMAVNMARSHDEVAQVTLFDDADVDAWGMAEDPTLRLLRAIAAAVAEIPDMNVWYDSHTQTRQIIQQVDVGVAVDTEDGLFVPVLRDVGARSDQDLREGLNRLKGDVKARSIPPREMQGATILLSNFGSIAGRYATPMVVPPTVAILGAGAICSDVVPVNGEVGIRNRMPLSLSFDHRVITGGEASRFLQAVLQHLARPTL